MIQIKTIEQIVREFASFEWPSEEVRSAAFNDLLVRRFREGQPLSKADARTARSLIARKLA